MNQFKETAAYKDLQSKICNEIAGVFLARLKEVGVPDDKLRQVSEDIGYDIVSAMSEIGGYETAGADQYLAALEEKTTYIAALEARVNEMAALEAKVKQMAVLETKVKEMTALQAKVKQMSALEAKVKEMATQKARVNEVAAQDISFDDMTATLEEKTDRVVQIEEEPKVQSLPRVEGVISQDKILNILNAAKAASA